MDFKIVTLDDTPDVRHAYAAGIAMACDVMAFRLDTAPWWMRPFVGFEVRAGIRSLRQSAGLIDAEAFGDLAPAASERVIGGSDSE